MKLQPTKSFTKSLSYYRDIWKYQYGFTDNEIFTYTHKIYMSLKSLTVMPHIGKPVNACSYYHIDNKHTRVYLINHAYSVFYRIINNAIYLGAMFSHHQNPKNIHF